MASKQLPLELLGSPELEAFVDSAGGTVDKSKKEYLKLLPCVYESISAIVSKETDSVNVGSFTYNGWTPKFNCPTSGMTFHFIDRQWKMRSMPLCFFATCDMSKTADDHEQIIAAAIKRNDKIGEHVLIFSGTSDNEAAVALGVDQFLNYTGPVRCICHTLSLAVNEACNSTPFHSSILEKINNISTYFNHHDTLSAKLIKHQCNDFDRDRIVTMDNQFHTRWNSKLKRP